MSSKKRLRDHMGLPLRWHVSISAMYNISLSPGPTLTATPLKTLPFVRLPSQPPRSNRCPSFAYRHACVGSDPAGLPSQPCIIYCCLLIPPSQPPRSKTLPFVRLQACMCRLRPSGLTITAMYNILLSPDPTLTATPLKNVALRSLTGMHSSAQTQRADHHSHV